MITSEINSALFNVKKCECYAIISKNNSVFANYAVVNTTDGKVISSVNENFLLISNETYLKNVKNISGVYPSWFFTDNKNYYFYAKHQKISDQIEVWLEIINTYDGHVSRKINYVFKIDNWYLFTDMCAIIDEDNEELRWNSLIDMKLLTDKWYETQCRSSYLIDFPQKYKHLAPLLYADTQFERLVSYLPLINSWFNNSFLEARKFSIKLFTHIIT